MARASAPNVYVNLAPKLLAPQQKVYRPVTPPKRVTPPSVIVWTDLDGEPWTDLDGEPWTD